MYPVSLKISGFKSFADPVDLSFAVGISAVVGPNGCGKSNIIEALRWVMGEGSARRLRSAGDMEEVIFAGSSERPPFSRAEVTLTLENSNAKLSTIAQASIGNDSLHNGVSRNDGLQASESAGDGDKVVRGNEGSVFARLRNEERVAISRRIEIGGGSTYRINGKEALARDVQTLCADIGLGANASALVGQGQVAELVKAKPSERRILIEEAAGVRGLYSRRSEIMNSLDNTRATLCRVEDILHEQSKRIKGLTQEDARAERHRVLSAQIKRWQASALVRESRALQENIDSLEARKQQLISSRDDGIVNAAKLEAQITDTEEQYRLAGDKELASATLWQNLGQEIALLEYSRKETEDKKASLEQHHASQIRTRDEQQKSLAELEPLWREAQELARQATVENTVEDTAEDGEVMQREGRLRVIGDEITAIDKQLVNLTERSRFLEKQGAVYTERLEVSRKAKDDIEKELAKLSRELQQSEVINNADSSSVRISQKPVGISVLAGTSLEELVSRKEQLAERIRSLESDSDERQREILPKLRRAEEELLQQRGVLDDEHRKTCTRLATERNRQHELLQRASSSFAQVEDVTGKSKVKMPAVKPLIVSLSVSEELSLALFGALGEDLFATLQEGGMRYWLELRRTETSVAPLPDGVTSLASHIKAPLALHARLSQVGLVSSNEQGVFLQAQLRQGQRLVARDGSSWRWDGLYSASSVARGVRKRIESFLQLDSLQKNFALNEDALSQTERTYASSVASLTKRLADTRASYQSVLLAEEEVTKELQELRANLRTADMLARKHEQQIERQAQLTLALDSSLEKQRSAKDGLEGLAEHTKLLEQKTELESKHQILLLEHARLSADKQREDRNRLHEQAEHDSRINKEKSLRSLIEHSNEILAKNAKDLTAIEAQLASLASQPALDSRRLKECKLRHREIDDQRRRDKNSLERLGIMLSRQRDLLRSCISKNDDREKDIIRLQVQGEHLPEELARLASRSQEELGCDLASLCARYDLDEKILLESADIQKAARRTALEKLSRMGDINFAAKQTLATLNKEHEKMQSQHSDIEAALSKLHQSVRKLEEEASSKLLRVREEVGAQFSSFMGRLFAGSDAELFFSDATDPISSGLEIRLTLPGKRIRSLRSMSGGEQALVALALILSVFSVSGGRFCILDEVDAPLDDSNVSRFCDLLEGIARNGDTRFFVVTHHRYTMSRAARLYGVAMPEPGCSRIVTVALEDALESVRVAAE